METPGARRTLGPCSFQGSVPGPASGVQPGLSVVGVRLKLPAPVHMGACAAGMFPRLLEGLSWMQREGQPLRPASPWLSRHRSACWFQTSAAFSSAAPSAPNTLSLSAHHTRSLAWKLSANITSSMTHSQVTKILMPVAVPSPSPTAQPSSPQELTLGLCDVQPFECPPSPLSPIISGSCSTPTPVPRTRLCTHDAQGVLTVECVTGESSSLASARA